jgi:peptide-methionine (R)-S-oxide reductase
MKKSVLILSPLAFLVLFSCNGQTPNNNSEPQNISAMDKTEKLNKTEEEWKKELTPEQYEVLRKKGTESPFSGKYWNVNEKGIYVCAACGNELFDSKTKFDAGCGWPSFFESLDSTKVKTQTDYTHGMVRTEIMCARCGSHLGHVFDDGPKPTGLRYCVNSISLDFKPSEKK